MNLLLNRAKANTTTTGTGAATPGTAVTPFRTWASSGAVSGNRYRYLIEDGFNWEVGSGIYNGTTITRPGPGVDPSFDSSSGSLLNLSGSATIACVANTNSFGEELLSNQVVSSVSSLVFDSTVINTFKAFKLRFCEAVGSASPTLAVQLSPDNGTTWRTANYAGTRLIEQIDGTFSTKNNTGSTFLPMIQEFFSDTATPSGGEMTIYHLLNAALKKFSTCRCATKASDGHRYDSFSGGEYTVAESINAIRIVPGSGTFSGTFQLLGVM